MKKFYLNFFLVLGLVGCETFPAWSLNSGDWALGINYPGVGIRYSLTDHWAGELKGQADSGLTVLGARGYYFFNPDSKLMFFSGLEFDTLSYQDDEIESSGFASEVFLGGEYYFAKNLSLLMDFGPAYIFLEETDTTTSVDGIEYIINFGINFYFGR